MRLIRHRSSLAVLTALLAASACVHSPTAPAGPSAALTALPRQLSPAEQSVLGAANAFSFALFGKVSAAQPDTNVFLSPLSASMSLGMALNGAANGTYDEMRSALQFGSTSQHDIDAGYHSLIALLTGLDPAVQLDVANSVWYDRTFPFYQSFLDTTRTYFDADVQPLDFTNQSASLAAINGWVNTKTNGKIPTILDAIRQGDVMYLVNAVYFNAHWRTRFDSALTQAAPFTPAAGAPQQVMLMHREGTMSYVQTGAYQAVDLAYGDSAFTMTVLLPAPGVSVDALADSLTPAFWTTLTTSLHGSKVDLYLPRMKLSYARTLNGDLKALGMNAAFVPDGADFTRMSSMGTALYVSFVKQKTFVSVDESGTEAAAVTVTGVATTAFEPPAVMRVDRPFVFVIRERLSGTILFMGKIASLPGA
ncbi:MAG TPA: serpin family protein [Gemmatimonadaceae bacterium]|nr:serpin family protein [Gemmatimonadaceae bacterium]